MYYFPRPEHIVFPDPFFKFPTKFLFLYFQDFLNQIDYDRTRFLRHVSERDFNEIMPYISTCFEIVWGMSVQDPPMYLLFKVKHGLEIASDKFERCPSHGKRVDYVMWPAVFKEEGGTCLQKGIVQALTERSWNIMMKILERNEVIHLLYGLFFENIYIFLVLLSVHGDLFQTVRFHLTEKCHLGV